jgi:hypothetical protein
MIKIGFLFRNDDEITNPFFGKYINPKKGFDLSFCK